MVVKYTMTLYNLMLFPWFVLRHQQFTNQWFYAIGTNVNTVGIKKVLPYSPPESFMGSPRFLQTTLGALLLYIFQNCSSKIWEDRVFVLLLQLPLFKSCRWRCSCSYIYSLACCNDSSVLRTKSQTRLSMQKDYLGRKQESFHTVIQVTHLCNEKEKEGGLKVGKKGRKTLRLQGKFKSNLARLMEIP